MTQISQQKAKNKVGSEAKRLFDRLEDAGVRFFSIQRATELGGKSYNATWMLLDHLTEAGWAVRAAQGLYALAGEDLNRYAVGRELAGGEHYYISHGSAMEVWGMGKTGQGQALPLRGATRPLRDSLVTVIVTLTDGRKMRRREVLGVEYRFVKDNLLGLEKMTNRTPRAEQWRLVEVEAAPGEKVWVSDPEWTILSGLARPDLCGGTAGVAQAAWIWRGRLDLEKLVKYANHIRNRTAVRRLGYVLEVLGLHTDESEFVLGFSVFESYGRLEPGKPAAGDLYRKWRLDVNTELHTEEIFNAD